MKIDFYHHDRCEACVNLLSLIDNCDNDSNDFYKIDVTSNIDKLKEVLPDITTLPAIIVEDDLSKIYQGKDCFDFIESIIETDKLKMVNVYKSKDSLNKISAYNKPKTNIVSLGEPIMTVSKDD